MMATEYKWVISQLECYPQHEGHTDVVFTVHWDRRATDGTYSARTYGAQSVTLDPDAPFTPYADLTEAQVVGWLEDAMGEEQLAAQVAALDTQIENQINPPVIRPPLPWATPPALLDPIGAPVLPTPDPEPEPAPEPPTPAV